MPHPLNLRPSFSSHIPYVVRTPISGGQPNHFVTSAYHTRFILGVICRSFLTFLKSKKYILYRLMSQEFIWFYFFLPPPIEELEYDRGAVLLPHFFVNNKTFPLQFLPTCRGITFLTLEKHSHRFEISLVPTIGCNSLSFFSSRFCRSSVSLLGGSFPTNKLNKYS